MTSKIEQEHAELTETGDAEEEEPRLKYQRLGSDVTELLGKNAATCLCISDKILALGTSSGMVHILDYSGNEVWSRLSFLPKPPSESPWEPSSHSVVGSKPLI